MKPRPERAGLKTSYRYDFTPFISLHFSFKGKKRFKNFSLPYK